MKDADVGVLKKERGELSREGFGMSIRGLAKM